MPGKFLLAVVLLGIETKTLAQVVAQDFPYPLLYESEDFTCSEVIEVSTFQGDCCSLHDTVDGGCALQVINGECRVSGPAFSVSSRSTYKFDDCPPSDYTYTVTISDNIFDREEEEETDREQETEDEIVDVEEDTDEDLEEMDPSGAPWRPLGSWMGAVFVSTAMLFPPC